MGSDRHDVLRGSDEVVVRYPASGTYSDEIWGARSGCGGSENAVRRARAFGTSQDIIDDQPSSSAATLFSWALHFIRSSQTHPKLIWVPGIG